MSNKNLHKAKKEMNDEFYTKITDIEKELKHYKNHFKNKIVLCNCDDPKESMFWKYFALNFNNLGLKKLITTHYEKDKASYKIEMNEMKRNVPIQSDVCTTSLKQNGDFRSKECIALLKEADIIVTNPPFSLFREYIKQLIDYDKQFLIIGNKMSIGYKEIFPYIQAEKLWVGFNMPPKFKLPNGDMKAVAAVWFTNLNHIKRHEKFISYQSYKGNENYYETYDNYDAINVNKTIDIPKNYTGLMGVPITYINKHNPSQFEIIHFRKGNDGKDLRINGKEKAQRIIIKWRNNNAT